MKRKREVVEIFCVSKEKGDFTYFIENVIDALLRMIVWILLISIVIIGVYEAPNISIWVDIADDYSCVMSNFYIDKNSNVNKVEMLNDFVETLPPVFIMEFRKDWKVIIGDYMPLYINWCDNITVGGYTDWNSRIIFIREQTDYTDTLDIFVHELGHCFDFEYGSISYSDLFDDIYNLYKDDFIEQYTNSPYGYSTSSSVEFFASCFKEYLLYPEHLKTVAPKAYNFVNDFYKDIQKIRYIYIYDLGAVANTVSRFSE